MVFGLVSAFLYHIGAVGAWTDGFLVGHVE